MEVGELNPDECSAMEMKMGELNPDECSAILVT